MIFIELDVKTSIEVNIQKFLFNYLNPKYFLPDKIIFWFFVFIQNMPLFLFMIGLQLEENLFRKTKLEIRLLAIISLDLIFKILYQETRPFWVYPLDKDLSYCSNTFGFPDNTNLWFYLMFIKPLKKNYIKIFILVITIFYYGRYIILLIFSYKKSKIV